MQCCFLNKDIEIVYSHMYIVAMKQAVFTQKIIECKSILCNTCLYFKHRILVIINDIQIFLK